MHKDIIRLIIIHTDLKTVYNTILASHLELRDDWWHHYFYIHVQGNMRPSFLQSQRIT